MGNATLEPRSAPPSGAVVKSILSLAAASAIAGAQAVAVSSWTGAVDNSWTTEANWTAGVPSEMVNADLRRANFSERFIAGGCVVEFPAACQNKWKIHVRDAGSAAAPIVFRAGGELISAHANLDVFLGCRGGAIDTAGRRVSVNEPLCAVQGEPAGELSVTGGGVLTLSAGLGENPCAVAVSLGTALRVRSTGDLGALRVAMPADPPSGCARLLLRVTGEGETIADGVVSAVAAASDGGYTHSVRHLADGVLRNLICLC